MKEKKAKPYKPQPFRDGNTVQRIYEENFVDAIGNKAIITKCDYKDKKNKLVEAYDLRVKWIPEVLKYTGKKKKKFIEDYLNENENLFYVYYDGYLIYFFNHEGKNYLSYFWDRNDDALTHMVFELNPNFEVPLISEESKIGETFEDAMELLVQGDYVDDYIVVKHYVHKDIEVIENNRARLIFNLMYEKYCDKKINYV